MNLAAVAAIMILRVAVCTPGLPEPVPVTWHDRILLTVADDPSVRIEEIGRSLKEEPIDAVWLRGARSNPDERRPALLIIAGMDGRHVCGSTVALGLMERIAKNRPKSLRGVDLIIIPCVNPDGMKAFDEGKPRRDSGANAAARTGARDDADRDRRMDEDGPIDIDGDGRVVQMRVKKPLPPWLRGAGPAQMAEPDEPRLMRAAGGAKGEKGEYVVLPEGKDQDGDGLIAEDGPEGVDLESNFPYHWPEFEASAGPTPLSEPESRAVADWLLTHPEVVAVLEYAPNDNLVNIPAPSEGKMDATGEAPQSGHVLDDDRQWYELVGSKYKEDTGMKGVGGITRSFDGSLQGWAYAHLGLAAFVTPAWVRPEPPKEAEPAKPASAEATKPVTEQGKAGGPPKKKVIDSEDGRWLAYSDGQAEAGGATGFLEWKPFEHPQLGRVEIGGWVAGFKLNPPVSEIERVVGEQEKFVGRLMSMLPRLSAAPGSAERLGERVWRVRVSASNEGLLPTRTAMGTRAHRLPNTRWEVDLPAARVISGARAQGVPSVAPGAQVTGEWVVMGEADEEVSFKLTSPEAGDIQVRVKLEAGQPAGGEPR